MNKICVSVSGPGFQECVRQLGNEALAELRLDLVRLNKQEIKNILQLPVEWVVTCRPGTYNDKSRKEILSYAIDCGASMVDVETESYQGYREEVIQKAKEKNCKVIISFHDFERTPSRIELEKITKTVFEQGADLAKIITTSISPDDNATILSLYDSFKNLIAFSMGEIGKFTRVKCLKLGAPFSYAAPDYGKSTAVGQFSVSKMRKQLKRLEFMKLGVAGNPILHSLSPTIWNAILNDMELDGNYLKIMASNAEEVIQIFKSVRLKGMSITAPFKETIIPFLDHVDDRARRVGAVNTVAYKNGELFGYNTDIDGVARSVEQYLFNGNGVALIGTGGAAKAAIEALDGLGAQITVFGRSPEKLKFFKDNYNCEILSISLLGKYLKNYKVIVSTLPAEADVFGNLKLLPFHIVLDANYKSSALEKLAKESQATFVSGKTWLGQQASPAFKHIVGLDASLKVILEAVENPGSNDFERIVLTGFMGVGKSSVGKVLARKLGYHFADTDQMIEDVEGQSINEIFDLKGEEYFRRQESQVLRELLQRENIVISCGGGITARKINQDIIRDKSLNFWLDASLKQCLEHADISHRPKLQHVNTAKTEQLFQDRKLGYSKSAHVLFNTENKTIEEISNRIYEEITAIKKI